MEQKVKKLIRCENKDILIVFDDGSGIACYDPSIVSKKEVQKIISNEISMVKGQHEKYLDLESIEKQLLETQDDGEKQEPTKDADGEAEPDDEEGDGDHSG
jgi:hypothetical protein